MEEGIGKIIFVFVKMPIYIKSCWLLEREKSFCLKFTVSLVMPIVSSWWGILRNDVKLGWEGIFAEIILKLKLFALLIKIFNSSVFILHCCELHEKALLCKK